MKNQPKHPCIGCIYFNACGETNRIMPCEGRMTKSEKKAEMQKQMEFLERENRKMREEIARKQQEEWDKLRPKAAEIFYKEMNKIFPEMVCKVSLEHIDSSGFWFTFELKNDSRRQTYAIRHTDLEDRL